MKRSLFVAATILSVAVGASYAEAQPFGSSSGGMHFGSDAGHAVLTGRSQVVTSGRVGNTYTTTLPGGGVGFLMNNGNGTSTLVGGGATTTIPTPRY